MGRREKEEDSNAVREMLFSMLIIADILSTYYAVFKRHRIIIWRLGEEPEKSDGMGLNATSGTRYNS